MKKRLLKFFVLLSAGAVLLPACNDGMEGDAYISFTLSPDYSYYSLNQLAQKLKSDGSDFSLPDTCDFILKVTGQDGETVYNGPYGERPDPMQVQSGTYDLSLYSIEFNEPAFASPQFGDCRTVVVGSGQNLSVAFACTQLNCGMRLIFSESFRERFMSAETVIESGEHSLPYPYTESRIGYFMPGILNVACMEDGNRIPILSRRLDAADILTIKLSATSGPSGSFSVEVDTARNWLFEDFTVGSGNDGSSMEKALSIADLAMYLGVEDVWVCGYVAGGDVSTSKINTQPPFSKNTNLAIADRPGTVERENCAAVELPDGDVRESLNLVDHPEMVGKKIFVKGDIENYYGHPGVKTVKEFQME